MLSNASLPPDMLVVVRGINERTQTALIALASEIVGENNVVSVTGNPFSETLRKSFQAGIDRGLAWTYCIDADVLLAPDALLNFRRAAQMSPSGLFGIQGLVLDKLFGGLRPAGGRIYRTELLKEAIAHIPSGSTSKRPETFVRRIMQQRGHGYIKMGILAGLHDFEQYYKDIYRTAFFHAQKHRKYVPVLRPYWERMSSTDPDFLVAIRGSDDGLHTEAILGLDSRNFTERSNEALAELGLEEKDKYDIDNQALASYVENTMLSWQTPKEYDEFWRQTLEPSRAARIMGPRVLRLLGLNAVPEQ